MMISGLRSANHSHAGHAEQGVRCRARQARARLRAYIARSGTIASKTRLTELIRRLDVGGALAGLDESPALISHRDDRGRNWLHLTCGVNAAEKHIDEQRAVDLATGLLDRGIDLNAPAFREGHWQATPLWYAVSRGRNLTLVNFLISVGSTPEHCLWAASFNQDLPIINSLIAAGASLETVVEDETPSFRAVKYSKFRAAAVLLEAGSNPNWVDPIQRTAMHAMLKKGTHIHHFEMFVKHAARTDIEDSEGRTVDAILRRKRDKAWHTLADRLATDV